MVERHVIIGVHITQRIQHAVEVQQVLTENGCNIKTRLGLHETGGDACSPNGLVLIEWVGDDATATAFMTKLNGIEGCEAKSMSFDHS